MTAADRARVDKARQEAYARWLRKHPTGSELEPSSTVFEAGWRAAVRYAQRNDPLAERADNAAASRVWRGGR